MWLIAINHLTALRDFYNFNFLIQLFLFHNYDFEFIDFL